MAWSNYIIYFLDILIIALFIYSLLLFMRRMRSYMIFLGMAITLGLYIFARYFHLELTSQALHYFVGASVVIFVVVFQVEIRKYLELLGLIGSRQIKVGKLANKSPSINEIVQSCVKMAQERTGALIVIQGSDNLDRFIEGGIPLDGVISEEVILSLFDPHSEGHDGALVVHNNRISRFGGQLPLSTNFKLIGKHGTRHSAGLGLAENSDALCLVVSEEKGTISICRNQSLTTLAEYSELEPELNKFIEAKFASTPESIISHMLTHNINFKALAVLLAFLIWFLNVYWT